MAGTGGDVSCRSFVSPPKRVLRHAQGTAVCSAAPLRAPEASPRPREPGAGRPLPLEERLRAVDEDFASRNVTGIVAREEKNQLRDLIRVAWHLARERDRAFRELHGKLDLVQVSP